MRLTPTEEERLRIFAAAELARRHLDRGLRLNAPEAIALIADEMHLAARAGATLEEVALAGETAVAENDLLDGVAGLVAEVRVEVLLDEGSRLVVVRPSWATTHEAPGAIRPADIERDVELALGRERRTLPVTNRSERPVRVSSHYPFWRANRRLEFDRDRTVGFRLDVPAGDSIRWAPGETREVTLVAYGGER